MIILSQGEWIRQRVEILERDNYICGYCGHEAHCVDHIIPRYQGGADDPENLVASCRSCNSKKSGRTVDQWNAGIPMSQIEKREIVGRYRTEYEQIAVKKKTKKRFDVARGRMTANIFMNMLLCAWETMTDQRRGEVFDLLNQECRDGKVDPPGRGPKSKKARELRDKESKS